MGMFEQTDVPVKTKLILRGTEFFQELECVVQFLSIAELRPLNRQAPNSVIGRKPHIGDQDKSPHSPLVASQQNAVYKGDCSLFLLSLEITLSQAFVSNGRTVLAW